MVNEVTLIGHVVALPEVHEFPSGKIKATFSVATNRTYKDREGEKQQDTSFHRVECWAKLAQIAREILDKGILIHVKGDIKYTSKEEEGRKQYFTAIQAHSINVLTPKESNQ